jgi:hypothetical protein
MKRSKFSRFGPGHRKILDPPWSCVADSLGEQAALGKNSAHRGYNSLDSPVCTRLCTPDSPVSQPRQ